MSQLEHRVARSWCLRLSLSLKWQTEELHATLYWGPSPPPHPGKGLASRAWQLKYTRILPGLHDQANSSVTLQWLRGSPFQTDLLMVAPSKSPSPWQHQGQTRQTSEQNAAEAETVIPISLIFARAYIPSIYVPNILTSSQRCLYHPR